MYRLTCILHFNLPTQAKTSSPGISAPPSSPLQKQQIHIPQEQQEQQQRFLQENQLQKEQLQRLFKNEDARPKKPRAYSSPAPYLSGQVSNTPKGEGLVNGVLPAGEGQSSRSKDKVKKSLTLSDMKAPISSGVSNLTARTYGIQ